ncbi:putative amino acid transporter [Xylona heveae TC161]|uniref:Putative amino acid transporter n=1 Tax=Xylona heveae (strain CBS 132557 / TC161) TaxID=1328760 RepID=A0A161THG9_XYLHT|nr:putative amino acid transporter [Xylona heveae TC161]KZF25697.1 putative amino acid transporter [Xylona heveae TC161]
MAGAELHSSRKDWPSVPETEEASSLLSSHSSETEPLERPPPPPRRQSSISQPPPNGAPRTPRTLNRVRFDIDEESPRSSTEERRMSDSWTVDDDFLADSSPWGRRASGGQRAPLLTDVEAPSVTVATEADFNAEDHLESARPRSGMKSAFMNMANSIIGAGIIGQPYALRQAGLITGILLLLILTITVDWTIRLIVINSKLSGANSFQSTVEHCFGKSGLIAISVAQWAFAFGGMLAFCIIVGDTIPHVLAALFPSLPNLPFLWLLADRRAVILIFICGVSYPLSLYRDIAKLAKASALALLSMIVIITTVITQGPRVAPELKGKVSGSIFMNSGIFQAIGVISFAFVCRKHPECAILDFNSHACVDHNSLLIYGSLRKPTLDRFSRVTHYSTAISMVACMAMALSGFLTFGDKTKGNVLNNFPTDNYMVNIARFCFGLNMLTTLPLEAFVCREVMTNYWFRDEPWNPNRHLLFTTSLVLTAVILSLITCDLGAVFELIGATSACALAYILPPLCYIKLSSRSWKTILAAVCAGFGFLVMGISILQAVAKTIRNEGGAQTC